MSLTPPLRLPAISATARASRSIADAAEPHRRRIVTRSDSAGGDGEATDVDVDTDDAFGGGDRGGGAAIDGRRRRVRRGTPWVRLALPAVWCRMDPIHYRGTRIEQLCGHHGRVLADGGYRGVPELVTLSFATTAFSATEHGLLIADEECRRLRGTFLAQSESDGWWLPVPRIRKNAAATSICTTREASRRCRLSLDRQHETQSEGEICLLIDGDHLRDKCNEKRWSMSPAEAIAVDQPIRRTHGSKSPAIATPRPMHNSIRVAVANRGMRQRRAVKSDTPSNHCV